MTEPNTPIFNRVKDFITDPKNIAKAVEGSMDKRNAVMTDTLDEQILEILKDYRLELTQQMGLILNGKHRLNIKTADEMLIDKPTKQLKTLFTEHSKQLLEDIRDCGERGGHDVACRTIGEELLNRLTQLSKRNKGEDNE